MIEIIKCFNLNYCLSWNVWSLYLLWSWLGGGSVSRLVCFVPDCIIMRTGWLLPIIQIIFCRPGIQENCASVVVRTCRCLCVSLPLSPPLPALIKHPAGQSFTLYRENWLPGTDLELLHGCFTLTLTTGYSRSLSFFQVIINIFPVIATLFSFLISALSRDLVDDLSLIEDPTHISVLSVRCEAWGVRCKWLLI